VAQFLDEFRLFEGGIQLDSMVGDEVVSILL
jgi:hypothetical protein